VRGHVWRCMRIGIRKKPSAPHAIAPMTDQMWSCGGKYPNSRAPIMPTMPRISGPSAPSSVRCAGDRRELPRFAMSVPLKHVANSTKIATELN
jgi:hypothetical protein